MPPHNEPDPHPRGAYSPAALAACEKALRTILTKIGPWGSQLILIGGMTPRYLVGQPPPDIRAHVGTTDLDIVIGVTLATEEAEAYRTLQQNLKDARFAPARDPESGQERTFRWERDVDGVRVQLEFFCPVGDGEPGKLMRNPGGAGSKISAVRIRGAELSALDHFMVPLGGELLDHGGIQERVDVKVSNLLPFLVLKAFALDERDKPKDGYDLVWTLSAFGEGPRSAVDAVVQSPVLACPEIPAAMACLREHFRTPGHRGPAQYANFESFSGDEGERERLRRFAHGTMREFLLQWDELGSTG